MRIIFVRHGHPDYVKDCLTELGHLQAEAAAERLKNEPFTRVFASSCGRAHETALHICEKKGVPLTAIFDFMRELDWGPIDNTPDWQKYNPWEICFDMVRGRETLLSGEWVNRADFSQSKIVGEVEKIGNAFDAFLETLGYKREGEYYRVNNATDETIVMVSHGGAASGVIARLFNLAFPFICTTLRWDFTAIAEVDFVGENGDLISPRFGLVNDSRHINGVKV